MDGAAFDLGSYGMEIVLNTSQFDQGMRDAEQQLNNNENKTKGWASNLGTIATGAVAGLGLALVGAAGAGLKMSDDLQKALNGLQTSTGATDNEMKGMEESLKNIYNNNFGQSFEDIAQSMALVKQNTGLAGKELENATQNALMLRDTFEFDVSESTNAANSMMKQFGITSDQAFNLIAQGAQNGANKNGDLIDSLNEYAPQFKAMGFSAEEFTNVLIDGAKNGAFSIDKVGDSMKEFNIRSKDLSATSLDAFKSLGFNGEQMSASFAKGGESAQKAFSQVMTALNNVKDPVEKNRIGIELFGTQFEDLQAKGIASLANIGKSASLSKDALGEINKVKYNTFGEALEGIKRNFQTALIEPMEKNVLPLLSDFTNWVNKHMPEIKSAIETSLNVVAKVFNGFKDSIKFVIDNMNILLPIILGVTGAITAQLVIDTVVSLYNKWKLATEAQTTVQWLLNAAMDANPIGVVALAIGALIAAGLALYMNWDKVSKFLSSTWTMIKSTAMTVFNFLVDFFKKWGLDILAGIMGPIGILALQIYKHWDEIKSKFVNTAHDIWNSVSSKFNSMKESLSTTVNNIKTSVSNVFTSVKNSLVNIATDIWNGVKGKFDSLKTSASTIFDDIRSKASDIFGKVKSAITNPIETAKNTVSKIIGEIKGFFTNLILKIPTPSLPKLPHFDLKWATKTFFGKEISYPTGFDVEWKATGGIADRAMIYGIGEAGREAIVPLDNPMYMAPFADAVADRLVNNLSKNTSKDVSNQTINLNNTFEFNVESKNFGEPDAKKITKIVFDEMMKQMKPYGIIK